MRQPVPAYDQRLPCTPIRERASRAAFQPLPWGDTRLCQLQPLHRHSEADIGLCAVLSLRLRRELRGLSCSSFS